VTARTSSPDERTYDDRTLAVLRHLFACAGFDDATTRSDRVEFGDLERASGRLARPGTAFGRPLDRPAAARLAGAARSGGFG
jgi:hypothetical protein